MRIRCIKQLNFDGTPADQRSPLMIDRTYDVIAVTIVRPGLIYYSILSEVGEDPRFALGMFNSSCFQIIEKSLAPSWEFKILEDLSVSLAPPSFTAPGMLEAFYDGEPDAVSAVSRDVAIVQEFVAKSNCR